MAIPIPIQPLNLRDRLPLVKALTCISYVLPGSRDDPTGFGSDPDS